MLSKSFTSVCRDRPYGGKGVNMEQEKNVNAIVEHILEAFEIEIENLPAGLEAKIAAQVEHIVSEANKDAANVYGDALTTTLGKAEQILRGLI